MSQLDKLCKEAISSHTIWEEILICGISDSIVTGNPFFPLFDYRNIKKECPSWFTCYENDYDQTILLNHPDFTQVLQVNTTGYNQYYQWIWTDC